MPKKTSTPAQELDDESLEWVTGGGPELREPAKVPVPVQTPGMSDETYKVILAHIQQQNGIRYKERYGNKS